MSHINNGRSKTDSSQDGSVVDPLEPVIPVSLVLNEPAGIPPQHIPPLNVNFEDSYSKAPLSSSNVTNENVMIITPHSNGEAHSARHQNNPGSLFRAASIGQPDFNEDVEDDDFIDEKTTLRRKYVSRAEDESIAADELSVDDIAQAESTGPPSALFPYTLRFKNKHLEAMFWGYNVPNYRSYALWAFLGSQLLFIIMLIQDLTFYFITWKDTQLCDGLFSPNCRSLGFRIVVSLFFVPAFALFLFLTVKYAEKLYDVQFKQVCLVCSRLVPIDLTLAAFFSTGIIIVSRTINTSASLLPIDYTSVCVFLFGFHVTAGYLNQSFGASIISCIGYLAYIGCAIGFAVTDGTLMYSHDYTNSSKIGKWSSSPVFNTKERNYEITWALLWPLCINVFSIIASRTIELSRRKQFALVRSYMLISQENTELEKQRNSVWNELCKVTDNRSDMILDGNNHNGHHNTTANGVNNNGDIDLTAPAELAMKLLQDIQHDGSVSNDVLLKARQVAEILMKPGELYTPAIVNNDAIGAGIVDIDTLGEEAVREQEEMQKWVAQQVNGNKANIPVGAQAVSASVLDESGHVVMVNMNTGKAALVLDDENVVIPACLEPILTGMSTVDVTNYSSALDEWDTDIEDIARVIGVDNTLLYVVITVMRKYNLFNKFQIHPDVMAAFVQQIQSHYHNDTNAFHNMIHAADVVKNVNCLLYSSGLYTVLSDVYILSIILASIVIDVGHPGIDSNFHIETSHELALVYNDRCVLENYHAAVLSRALMQHAVLQNVTVERKKQIRSNSIELILASDVNTHFDILGQHKTILAGAMAMNLSLADLPPSTEDADITNLETQVFKHPTSTHVMLHKLKLSLLKLVLKCSDMGFCAKPLPIHNRWSAYLFDEQFKQGDEEARLGLVVSPFMNRDKTNVPLAQVGLIDYIAKPMFALLTDALELDTTTVRCQEYIAANRQHWQDM